MLSTDSQEIAQQHIDEAKSKDGFALKNYFYRSDVVYQRELSEIIFKSWFYACHVSEIPNKGDFKTVEVGEDSIIIARKKNGDISARANTCRHRGARVCLEKQGNAKSFICPYHAWVYDVGGELIGARSMGDDFNKKDYGLKKIRTHIFQGLIFINCDPNAPDFSASTAKLLPAISPYNLEHAKVAASKTYPIEANWKLVLENYLECYHCGPSHKEYAKSHTLRDESHKVADLNETMKKRAVDEYGFEEAFIKPITNQYSDSSEFGCSVSHMRYALFDGFKTGTLDGEPVAPLMGNFKGYDGGAGDFQLGPLTFMLNYPDHCVLYRFLPRGFNKSEMELVWFVNEDAVEGKDYEVDRLIKLWDFTTEEDKFIISQNSQGVNSRLYEPGPYSPVFESLCNNFIRWYLGAIGD